MPPNPSANYNDILNDLGYGRSMGTFLYPLADWNGTVVNCSAAISSDFQVHVWNVTGKGSGNEKRENKRDV